MSERLTTPIEEGMLQRTSEVVCLKCLTRYIDVRPMGTLLKTLECPTCGPGYIIETGEVVE